MSRPRLLTGILLLALLVLAADTLVWWRLQHLLDRRLVSVAQQSARAGWRLEAVAGRRGGWPLAATRRFDGVRMSQGGIVWSGADITAAWSLLHPWRITILAAGPQMIAADGAGIGRSLRVWGSGMALHLPVGPAMLDAGRLDQVRFDAGSLHVALPGAGPDDVVTAGHVRGLLRWNPGAHALTLTLRDLVLPRAGAVTIGNRLPDASLEMSLIGDTGKAGDDVASRLRTWRADHGRLLLRQASLGWPGASIEASGHACLDGNFQLDGGFAVRVTGVDVLLDRLAHSGKVAPSAVSAVRAVLGLIAAGRGGPAGSPDRMPLELWLTLHAGMLSLGQIPLLQIRAPLPAGPEAMRDTLP